MITKLINKLMNTEEIVVEEVVETPIVATEVETKLPNITVNDQTGNLVQTFTNVGEAIAFAGENGYQVNIG